MYSANMWAEDDSAAAAAPCLQSLNEPSEGIVYTMYHGTSKEAAEKIQREGFRQSADGMLGCGVYLSRDLQKASRYPLHLPEDAVNVNVGKVKKIDSQIDSRRSTHHPMRTTWHDQEYDTAWCPPNCGMVPSGLEEDCVWDPKRITVLDVMPSCLQNRLEPQNVYRMYHGTAAERPKNEVIYQSFGAVVGHGVYRSRQSQTRDPVSLIRQRSNRGMTLSVMANVKKGNKRR